jgi:biopolymer transport protein ExbD
MAGGAALSAPQKVKRGKQSKRKKKARIGFHLDTTPLVDITFLLLTFFMFTTTMLKPQTMDMSIPAENTQQVEIKAKIMFTVLVREDGSVFYYREVLKKESIKPITNMNELEGIAVSENLNPDPEVLNKLLTVLRVDDNAKWDKVVEVLDALNRAELKITEKLPQGMVRARKFNMTAISQEEKDMIKDM